MLTAIMDAITKTTNNILGLLLKSVSLITANVSL
jgi:hypothetical protein